LANPSQVAAYSAWKQLLELSEQLVSQPAIAAQHRLIAKTASEMLEGQVDLWLNAALQRLSDPEDLKWLASQPSSDLARRAVDTRQAVLDGPDAPLSVAVPLLTQGIVLGVLQATRTVEPPFSRAEIELLDALANQSAIALKASWQASIDQWRVDQLALVHTVSAQIADILDLDVLSRRVTQLLLDTFHYYYAALFFLDANQVDLRCRASAGPRDQHSDTPRPPFAPEVRVGQGIVGYVAETGLEILSNDVSLEPHYRHVDSLPATQSEIALPLQIEERVLGVLDVQSDQKNGFDETDLLVLRALADNVAIAIEHARVCDDLYHRADRFAAIVEVSRAVASILDLDVLLKEVVAIIHRQFGYPFVHLYTIDPVQRQIVYHAGSGQRSQVLETQGLIYDMDDPEGIIPWVARNGETVLANDVNREPRYRPPELAPSTIGSELAVPLAFANQVLGVLDVQSEHQHAFGQDDRALFEALADDVAIAIRNANLYRSERWRRQVADSLREVAGLLSTDTVLEQVLHAILVELEYTLNYDVAAIWLLEEDELRVASVRGLPEDRDLEDLQVQDTPWIAQALEANDPVIRSPGSEVDPLGRILAFPPEYSAIAAPLRAGDRRLGLIALVQKVPGCYASECQTLMAAFASYAAVAIGNARLYQESQAQGLISTVMLDVAEAAQSLTALDPLLEAVVRLAATSIGVNQCGILLWDESIAAFVPAATYGLDPAQRSAFDQLQIVRGQVAAFDELYSHMTPLVIYDTASDPRLAGASIAESGFESLLLVPLLVQGAVLGAIMIEYPGSQLGLDASQTLLEARLAIVQGIAHQAATAVDNIRLREAQQEEAYVSAALLQVAQAVTGLNSLDDVLGAIVRITPILVGVERCMVFLWDEEKAVYWAAQVYGISREAEASLLAQRYAPGDFALLDAAREQDSLIIHAYGTPGSQDGTVPPDFASRFVAAEQAEFRSLLAVPLSMKGEVVGVMMLEEASGLGGSRERRLEIITGIAHQAAMAVQSERLQQERVERERLERELQLAHEIQRAFIPSQLPDTPGWELAARWLAARQVSGDFYDLLDLPGQRLGLIIADVADHGMPAALFMALTRTLMRAAALEGLSPAAVLGRVNDLLVPDAQHGMFVTALYGILSLETGELIYANAGHTLPQLRRARTQRLEALAKGGMALGVMEGIDLAEHEITLEPGDLLVLYTDGVTEAFSPDDVIYGTGHLQETLLSADDLSAQAVLEAIERSVLAFVDGEDPSDDLTLMVLRRQE
jgi:sigma-B regulation protein RsbU (phosphoserine phosphatase)